MGAAELISLQLRMFLMMLLGLLFRKKNLITAEGKKNLTDLVIYLILPCNIIKSFMIPFDNNTLVNFGKILLISVLIQVFCAILAKGLFRKASESHRPVLMYATVASNSGFLGNPVAEGVFGSMGLALASVYLIPQRIVMWSAGVSYFTQGSDRKTVFKRVITHPCILAVFAGLILMVTQVSLPGFLNATIKDIGNCNTAMSMMVIGTILADVRPRELLDLSLFLFSGLRLILLRIRLLPLRRRHQRAEYQYRQRHYDPRCQHDSHSCRKIWRRRRLRRKMCGADHGFVLAGNSGLEHGSGVGRLPASFDFDM